MKISANKKITGLFPVNPFVVFIFYALYWNSLSYVAEAADFGVDVSVDSAGNVFFAGIFGLEVDLIVKYNKEGKELWERIYESKGGIIGICHSISSDAVGNAYVLGEIPKSNKKSSRLFPAIVKYSKDGERLWDVHYKVRKKDSLGLDHISVDNKSNCYVSGTYEWDYWGQHEPDWLGPDPNTDFITIKYDSNGKELWEARHTLPEWHDNTLSDMAVDTMGDVYVTGSVHLTRPWRHCIDTIKYDTNGKQLWLARHSAGRDEIKADHLALDKVGNIYVVGRKIKNSKATWIIVKYDMNGNEQWVACTPDFEDKMNPITDIAIDQACNIYILAYLPWENVGALWYTIHLADDEKRLSAQSKFVLLKYDSNGKTQWIASYEGKEEEDLYATDLLLGSQGNVHVVCSLFIDRENELRIVTYGKNGAEKSLKQLYRVSQFAVFLSRLKQSRWH